MEIDGDSWLVALDVANALGYKQRNDMVRHMDSDEVYKIKSDNFSGLKDVGNNDLTVISESGLHYAVSRLDDDEKGVTTNDTLGGSQQMATINESGLYSLILTSRKPEKWYPNGLQSQESFPWSNVRVDSQLCISRLPECLLVFGVATE